MTPAAGRTTGWGDEQREAEHRLLAEFSQLTEDDPRRAAVRDELVTMHLPLVRHLARRYRESGESMEDLTQVGTIGLIKAVDRFDVDRGTEFSTFATPTILGEIKRHFRDRTWALRVPRRLQELSGRVSGCTDDLVATLHRSPTVREVAEALEISEEDVLAAIEIRHAYTTASISAERSDDRSDSIAESLGSDDPAFEALEDSEALRPLLAALPDRERRIVMMRFFGNLSQTQIASEMGISQMHVSRLLARALLTLRSGLTEG